MIEIKDRFTGRILFTSEKETIKDAVIAAYLRGAYLRGANLGGANLGGADLGGANLGGADLRGANLGGAYLDGAYLDGAYLRGAYLRGAYLRGAYLRGADLRGANLGGAYLDGAYLDGVLNYSENHDIFFELIRREKAADIKKSEWNLIGQLAIHRPCWSSIAKYPTRPALRILKMLAAKGFDEYFKKYKSVIERSKDNER
jgi:hypothetical protein